MTCIIVASSGEETVLVADRRLTANGQVDENDAGKTVLLVTRNFRFMVAFTGLAKFGTFKTIDWLNTTLMTLLKDDLSPKEFLECFQGLAASEIGRLRVRPQRAKRLTFVFVGYIYHGDEARTCCLRVSNFERWQTDDLDLPEDFQTSGYLPTAETGYSYVGAFGVVRPSLKAELMLRLGHLAGKKPPGIAMTNLAVEILLDFARSDKSQGLVGESCSTLALRFEKNKPVIASYYSREHPEHVIVPDLIVWDPEFFTMDAPTHTPSWVIAFQAQSDMHLQFGMDPDALCHCGSGRRYRRCHRRGEFDPRQLLPHPTTPASDAPDYVPVLRFVSPPLGPAS
ncbi:MAG: SEC-C domain-containing protein [Acidobacteria bacterium]|nr:SEC-C domain-containing protein [Acidobacteriota bacterium]